MNLMQGTNAATPLRLRERDEQSTLGSVVKLVKDGFAREEHLQGALPGNHRRFSVPLEFRRVHLRITRDARELCRDD